MSNIFPIDFEEKLTMAQDDYILFSDSEDGNKIKKAQYKNLKGEQGNPGQDGADGAAATITVGSTTTGTPGSSASVTNSGTSSAAVLDFTIPQGAKGETGAGATVAIGTTTTLPAGSSATVTNSGTSTNAVLNFGIPKGDSGSGSGDVNGPASSTDGDVAIFDGATGKLIKDGSVALSTLSSAASLASSAIQPGDDISDLNNDSGFITGIDSTDVTTALGYTPYDASNPSGYTTNTGDVVGPASSTDGHLAVFDGATGKLIKDGGSVPTGVPSGGTDGQVLSKVSGSVAWASLTIPSVSTITVTLASANWSNNEITVTATGVTATNSVIVSPDPSSMTDYTDGGIYCSAQASNSLTFVCGTVPSNNIDVNVLVLSAEAGSTPTPGGWQPGVNTLLYVPMKTDLTDHGPNQLTLTNSGVSLASSQANIDVGFFDGSSYISGTSNLALSGDFHIGVWLKYDTITINFILAGISHGGIFYGYDALYGYGVGRNMVAWDTSTSYTFNADTWYYLSVDRQGTTLALSVNGAEVYSATNSNSYNTSGGFQIGNDGTGQFVDGWMSDLIVESVGWTATENTNYYNLTKANYGIS